MKVINKTETYLQAEIGHAWTHYRHLEETRTKYLSFFATLILTSAGFLVNILKDMNKFDLTYLIASVAVFSFLLFLFSFFIWANIARIGFVLASYEGIMNETRGYMLGSNSSAFQLWNIRSRIPPSVSKGIFSVQSAASSFVLIVCFLLFSAEVYLSYVIFLGVISAPLWLGYVFSSFALIIFTSVIYGFNLLIKANRYEVPKMELSQFELYKVDREI